MPRKPRIEVHERALQTDVNSIIQSDPRYRARMDSPFNEPSAPITLKDSSRECRWFNASIATDHIWRSKRKGWDQVRPGDVLDLEQIGGYNVTGGFITRGERGQEVLMSMPKVVRQAIQTQKTLMNNANVGNPNRMKTEVLNAAGNQIGSEAADFLESHIGPVGEIRDYKERVERSVESE